MQVVGNKGDTSFDGEKDVVVDSESKREEKRVIEVGEWVEIRFSADFITS